MEKGEEKGESGTRKFLNVEILWEGRKKRRQ